MMNSHTIIMLILSNLTNIMMLQRQRAVIFFQICMIMTVLSIWEIQKGLGSNILTISGQTLTNNDARPTTNKNTRKTPIK